MNGHHLILGEIPDIITGKTIPDTHDERYRQKIARLLLEKLGYEKQDIETRYELCLKVDEKCAIIKLDFKIRLHGQIVMIIQYGPGSIVTRHRPVIAASRLVANYQVPFAVVTNGENADILDGVTGKVLTGGIESIPARADLIEKKVWEHLKPIPSEQATMESRILYAFEVDDRCPCDDDVCRL